MKLSIVVPCYNEEENILAFYKVCEQELQSVLFQYEYIFINDGSKDNTYLALKELHQSSTRFIQVIHFSRNFGKEAAMYAGLQHARSEYTCIIDADLQQNPKYVLQMLTMLDDHEEYDAIAAYQAIRKEGFILSSFKKAFYSLINRISDVEFKNGASDFRMLRRIVVDAILDLDEYYRFSKGIFSWIGFKTHFIEYEVEYRNGGSSSWSFWKLFKYAINGIVSYTTTPLRISTLAGITISFLSFLYLAFVIFQKLFLSIDVPGYATLITTVLFLGGLQLLSIGIIGEYLAKTYVEVKHRPIYIKKETLDYQQTKEEKHE